MFSSFGWSTFTLLAISMALALMEVQPFVTAALFGAAWGLGWAATMAAVMLGLGNVLLKFVGFILGTGVIWGGWKVWQISHQALYVQYFEPAAKVFFASILLCGIMNLRVSQRFASSG